MPFCCLVGVASACWKCFSLARACPSCFGRPSAPHALGGCVVCLLFSPNREFALRQYENNYSCFLIVNPLNQGQAVPAYERGRGRASILSHEVELVKFTDSAAT